MTEYMEFKAPLISPAEAANQILAELNGKVDVAQLIEQARQRLGVAPPPSEKKQVEANDPAMMNELVARQDELATIEKRAKEAREGIKQIIRDYMGEADELKVHGVVVATNRAPQAARILDQAAIKAKYPDIPGNEFFWMSAASSRSLRFK